jgi:pyruvate,water dikinase
MYRSLKNMLVACLRKNRELPIARFLEKFQVILAKSNETLHLMSDMNDKLGGEYVFDLHYIEESAEKLDDLLLKIISEIKILTHHNTLDLFPAFERIQHTIQEELAGKHVLTAEAMVLPLYEVTDWQRDLVGGKMERLAGLSSHLGLKIPDGFVITTQPFFQHLRNSGLENVIEEAKYRLDKNDEDGWRRLARTMRQQIINTPLPRKLASRIYHEFDALAERTNKNNIRVAMRSSAWGEGGKASFAGLYETRLNLSRDQIIDGYLQIIASAYSLKALQYRFTKGYGEQEVAMAVACQVMTESTASGVLHTYISHKSRGAIHINSMWGYCSGIMEGSHSADTIILDREPPYSILFEKITEKSKQLIPTGKGEMVWSELAEEMHHIRSLTPEQLETLAQTAKSIERYYKRPQEIEWTFERNGKLSILQTRDSPEKETLTEEQPFQTNITRDAEIIFSDRGVSVQRGIAIGKVFVIDEKNDLNDFPHGAILLTRHASPRFAAIMHKTRGIITDIGSVSGHMSTLAHEFRVPTVVDTEIATQYLKHGDEITLDATQNIVYRGRLTELDRFELTVEEVFEDSSEYRLLRRLLNHIYPITILEPQLDKITPDLCKTYHDIIAVTHKLAIEEIVHLSEKHATKTFPPPKQMKTAIPLGLMIIDAGKGTTCSPAERCIAPEQIVSRPLRDFWQGLEESDMWQNDPVSVDMGSFMSSMTRTFSTSLAAPEKVGRNLAVILDNYMNLSIQLGYHSTSIEAYMADNIDDNTIYFKFFGGATEFIRRARRTLFITNVLRHYDFMVEIQGDLVAGRVKKLSIDRMSRRMMILGGLVGYTRQLDALMNSDDDVLHHTRQFIKTIERMTTGERK